MLDSLRVAKGLPRNCQRAALALPSDWLGICEGSQDYLRAAVGLPWVLPMACFGIGEGLGLPKGHLRDCGFANGLFLDFAIVALGLPRESRAMAFGYGFGIALGVAQGVPGDCHRIALGWRGSQWVA